MLDTFDFPAIPSVNKTLVLVLVLVLARCEYIQRRENVIAVGNSGTGKTHIGLGLGLAACQRGMSMGFTTIATLVHGMMEARDERRLLNLQRQLSRLNLLIINELGFVPLSRTGAELLFEVFSQRYERGSTMVTTNLPFDEWRGSLRLGTPHRGAAGPAHPSRPHPGDERRELPTQAQSGERRLASSRRSRGGIGRTVNTVSSCSFNVPSPLDLPTSVITSVVRDSAAPVAHIIGALTARNWSTHRRRATAKAAATSSWEGERQ